MSTANCTTIVKQSNALDYSKISISERLKTVATVIQVWRRNASGRHELKLLAEDPDLLKDIGVSQGDALIEANKPFWKD